MNPDISGNPAATDHNDALARMEALQNQSMDFSLRQRELQVTFESKMAAIDAERNSTHAAAQAMKRGAAQMGQA